MAIRVSSIFPNQKFYCVRLNVLKSRKRATDEPGEGEAMQHIVIVEGNEEIRSSIGDIIRTVAESSLIFEFDHGARAHEFARENPVSLFVVAMGLRDCSGIDFVEKIRAMGRYKLTPIIFMASMPEMELVVYRELHCYGYLLKPFSAERARRLIGEVLSCNAASLDIERKVQFKQKDIDLWLRESEIIYIESVKRQIKLKTVKETIELSSYRLSEIEGMLSEDFIRCHRGFIVNRRYIRAMDKVCRHIFLEVAHESIPYGLKYRGDLMEGLRGLERGLRGK